MIKNITRIGKINLLLGAIFIITGLLLFEQKFVNEIDFKEQGIALPFIFLGIALFISAFFQKKAENE